MKNFIYDLNVPKSLRRSSWIKDHDFDPFFRVLTWATSVSDEDKVILRILLKRIRDMYIQQGRRRNLKFVYTYLKEVYTICTSVKVQSTYTPKLGVAVGKVTRLPLIIPGRIRKRLLSDRRLYITTMTILGIHRIIPWWPDVDYSSILDPFNGRYKTLSADMIKLSRIKLMKLRGSINIKFVDLKARALLPRSAGPNAGVAWKGVFPDTVAILNRPKYWVALIEWFYLTKSWSMLIAFLLMSIFAFFYLVVIALSPYRFWINRFRDFLLKVSFLIYRRLLADYKMRMRNPWFWATEGVSRCDLNLWKGIHFIIKCIPVFDYDPAISASITVCSQPWFSRVSAVFNTAGKARVIGITNYWIQCAFYPLHKSIFQFLRGLPTDGTFNQLSPIWALRATGRPYYSFDLSSATDRLPRELQKDILSTFIGERLSNLWNSLVDMPFGVKLEGREIYYSVGQPMGAYSSWAMLALTHHFIVQSYYSRDPEKDYAILGDDVVVPEYLANHYRNIMESLGVSISLPKSIVSTDMIEFAKRVRTLDGEDLSIIGPGLIMSAVRYRWMSALVLAESCKKGLQRWTASLKLLKNQPGFHQDDDLFGSLVLFGPRPLLKDSHANAVLPPGKARAISQPAEESHYVLTYIRDYLVKEESRKYDKQVQECRKTLLNLFGRLVKISGLRDRVGVFPMILGAIELLSLLVAPTTWFIIRECIATIWLMESPSEKYSRTSRSIKEVVSELLEGNPALHWSLDPPDHQKVKSSRLTLQKLMDSFPWMEGLKPRVTIPIKDGSLNRGEPFLEEEFPGLYRPIGPKVQLDYRGEYIPSKSGKVRVPWVAPKPGARGTWQNHDGHDLGPQVPPKTWKGMFGKHF